MKKTKRVALLLLCSAIPQLVHAQLADSAPFNDGLADRTAWEDWIGHQQGDVQRGALFWASQRSLAKPASCYGPKGAAIGDFTVGCVAAQKRLGPADSRRRTEADYRSGWNAFRSPVAAAPDQPLTLAGCRTVGDAAARLACYDGLSEGTQSSPPPTGNQLPAPALPPSNNTAATKPEAPPIVLTPVSSNTATVDKSQPSPALRTLPPRDLAAAPWLIEIAPRLYDDAKASILVADCRDQNRGLAVQIGAIFSNAVKTLSAADQAYANRIDLAGLEDGNHAVERVGKEAACRWAAAMYGRMDALANDTAGFWDGEQPTPQPAISQPTTGVALQAPELPPVSATQAGVGATQSDTFESDYVQALVGYAKAASTAVACGFRSPSWGEQLRARIRATVGAHAGAPYEDPHVPSDAERNTVLRSFDRSEAAGQRDAGNAVICDVTRKMALTELDDFEDGAVSLWPTFP